MPREIVIKDGLPVLLADVEEEIPELVMPSSTSGPAEWGRYHDAVRECARSFDSPQEGDIYHFLQARARNPEKVDVPAFHEAVKRQRVADLVDISDHAMRREGSLTRGARMVRTQAPRGYTRRALKALNVEETAHLRHRLIAIGHKPENVDRHLSDRVNPDIYDQASALEVRTSDSEFSFADVNDEEFNPAFEELAEMMSAIMKVIPPPVINVYVGGEKLHVEP